MVGVAGFEPATPSSRTRGAGTRSQACGARAAHEAVLDWQSRQQTRSNVLTTIRFTLNELPEEPYPEAICGRRRWTRSWSWPSRLRRRRPHQSIELGIGRTMDDMSDDELLSIVNGADEQKLIAPAN